MSYHIRFHQHLVCGSVKLCAGRTTTVCGSVNITSPCKSFKSDGSSPGDEMPMLPWLCMSTTSTAELSFQAHSPPTGHPMIPMKAKIEQHYARPGRSFPRRRVKDTRVNSKEPITSNMKDSKDWSYRRAEKTARPSSPSEISMLILLKILSHPAMIYGHTQRYCLF